MDNNTASLLVSLVCLVYHESQIDHKNTSIDWAISVTEKIKSGKSEVVNESNAIDQVKNLIHELRDSIYLGPINPDVWMPRLRTACGINTAMYEAIEISIYKKYADDAERLKTIIELSNTAKVVSRIDDVIKQLSDRIYSLRFGPKSNAHMRDCISEIAALSTEFSGTFAGESDPAIITSWDIVKDSAEVGLSIVKESVDIADATHGYKLGWQAMNSMFGGRLLPSKFMMWLGMQNNGKSLLNNIMFRQIAEYNEPILRDQTKRPLMIYITYENPVSETILFMYQNIMENIYGTIPKLKKADMSEAKYEEIRAYVVNHLSKTGFHPIFLHVNASKWSWAQLYHKLNTYRKKGAEICILNMDYLFKLPTTGLITGRSAGGEDVRLLFANARDGFCHEGTIVMTPHQISTEGKTDYRNGHDSIAKRWAGKSFYQGSKAINEVIDYSFTHHRVQYRDKWYMEVALDKYRVAGQNSQLNYFLLPFNPNGFILDDLNGDNSACTVLGGGAIGSPDECPDGSFF